MDAEPTQEERMELLDDIKFAKKATKMIELAARRLRRHNYDKGKGQPGWCSIETKQGPNSRVMSAGPEFAGLIYNVGPARSEVEAMMEWGCDFQSTGGEACTATAESRRVAFTFPPDVYPKIDWHMMEFLDDLGDALAPCEMGRFADPLGRTVTGAPKMKGAFRGRRDSRDAVAKASYRVREVDRRRGGAVGPCNHILNAVSSITHGSSTAAFAAVGIQRTDKTFARAKAIDIMDADAADLAERASLDADLGVGAWGEEGEEEKEETEQKAEGYSSICEYMIPLEGEQFKLWVKEWQRCTNLSPKYLETLRQKGLSRMFCSAWCCVFATFASHTDLEARTGTVVLDIVTRRGYDNMRHGYRTARSTVFWLFKNTAVGACNLDTADKGGRLWWRLAGVVCIVNRQARGYGTFTLMPLATGYDGSWGPDTDDEDDEFVLESEPEIGDGIDYSIWADDSIHKQRRMPPLMDRMRHVRVNGAVLTEADDQYFVDALAHANDYAQRKTGLAPSFAAHSTTMQNIDAHRRVQAIITADAILSGHESRTGYRRRVTQMKAMGALKIDVNNHSARLHPTDAEVAAEMNLLLDQPVSRSVRTLHGITGEGADVPLGDAISFALEGVGRLIHAPTSTRHAIVRFSSEYFKTLRLPVPGQRPPPLARTDDWSDDYVLVGAPSPIDAYSPRAAASNLPNALGALLNLPVLCVDGLHRTCILSAEVIPSEHPDVVDVFVYTTKNRARAVIIAAEHLTMEWNANSGGQAPNITAVCVPLLRVWFMADAGARTDRSLVGGQTIMIFKFADLVGMVESLTYNAYPVLAYTGPDDGPTMWSYYQNLEQAKRHHRRHRIMVNGRVHGFEDGWGADGKGRRDQLGGVNAAGGGKDKWCNECCTVCTATLRSNFPSCHVCTPRVVEDAFMPDGTVALGMETGGLIRYHFGRTAELAKMLRKEQELARILPFLQKSKADDDSWDAPIHVGQSFGQADNELTSPIFTPVEKAKSIIRWLDSGVYKHGPIQVVKKRLKTLLEEEESKAAFVAEAEEQILRVEQMLRTEGKTHKRDVLPGLTALLNELVDNLQMVENYMKSACLEMGAKFNDAVKDFLTPTGGPLLGVKVGETIVSPFTTLDMIPQARARAQWILLQIRAATQATGLEQPVLTAKTDAALSELIGFKYPANVPEHTGETGGLYLMAGGAPTKDHCRDATQGLKSLCLFDIMPTLGILHIFTIRGWGTLFSAIGMLAWVTGTAKSLCNQLRGLGLNVHFYKKTYSTQTLEFGGIKAKGYDSVRIMMNPAIFFGALPQTQRAAVNDIVQLWCAIWLTVGCSMLGHTGCNMYRKNKAETKAVIRLRAVARVRAMAALLGQLLHGTFGRCVWTPTLHSLCYDVPDAFAIADLYPGREDSIEGCQQLARTILKKCVGVGDRNSETLRRWYALLGARRRVVPAPKFLVVALRRQLIQWNTKRAQAVTRAEAVLQLYTDLNGGEPVSGPPLNTYICVYHPDVDMREHELYDPEAPPGQWLQLPSGKWTHYEWNAGDDDDDEDRRPPGSWTKPLFARIFGEPSLTQKLKGHDDKLYGGVQVHKDAADGNTEEVLAAKQKAASEKQAAPQKSQKNGKRKGKGKRPKAAARRRKAAAQTRQAKPAASNTKVATRRQEDQEPAAKKQKLDADGAAASAPPGPESDGEPESDEDELVYQCSVNQRETDAAAKRRVSRDATKQTMFDLGLDFDDDNLLGDDEEGTDTSAAGLAAGIADGAAEFIQGVIAEEDADEGSDTYSEDDGWAEGTDVQGRVDRVESATGGESDKRRYDASVDGVGPLEGCDFEILAYRQLALVLGPAARQTERPHNPARTYRYLDSVEFAVMAHSGVWTYFEGHVADADIGFGKNGPKRNMQVHVNINAVDGTGVQNVKYDLVRPLAGRRGRGANKFNNPFMSEEKTYKAEFGGLKKSVGGIVGWGLRCRGVGWAQAEGQVNVLPLRPIDGPPHEAWARVGGDDSDIVHVVAVGDVLLGMERPTHVDMRHRRTDSTRPTYRIPLERQLEAHTELDKLLKPAASSTRAMPPPAIPPRTKKPKATEPKNGQVVTASKSKKPVSKKKKKARKAQSIGGTSSSEGDSDDELPVSDLRRK